VATAEAFAAALPTWRRAWAVPQRVYLSMGDNRLLIDLDDPTQADQLRDELREMPDAGAVMLEEPLPDPASAWLPEPGGRYVTELVVPLVLREARREPEPRSPPAATPRPQRTVTRASRLRPPGSDWLFLKLYCPRAVEDDLIAGSIRPIGELVAGAGLAAEWFFLRYADADPHLRIRFRGEPETLVGRLLPELCRWATELVDDERCSRFAFDTYDREIERYGGDEATAAAECVFAADSRAVAELLALAPEPSPGRRPNAARGAERG
jgi:lantibiotic biosynthesis protein